MSQYNIRTVVLLLCVVCYANACWLLDDIEAVSVCGFSSQPDDSQQYTNKRSLHGDVYCNKSFTSDELQDGWRTLGRANSGKFYPLIFS